jgi:DNA repair exonuclease SbcCD ATPase subunit
MSLVVEEVREAMSSLRDLVSRHQGYVQQADFVDGGNRRAGLVARVPANELAAFRKAFTDLGEVSSEAERVDDVSEERADIGARLRNARAQEKRLLELLSYQTGSLADVLAVEEELSQVRESIERIEARQKRLENEIAYASVHVDIRARYVAFWKHPRAAIADAAQSGIRAAWSFLVGVVVVVAKAGPTAVLIALMAFFVFLPVRFLRRLRNRATARS